jgi:GDP-4-dehydro-6-deoxy-D-mannose reductase
VPSLAAQIACIEQTPPLRVGNLEPERDFLDVRDVVRAHAGLIERAATLPMRAAFNISTGRAVRVAANLGVNGCRYVFGID